MASLYSGKESINPPKQGLPNVSQYGWSAVEYDDYKQFIEYINEVKQVLDEANTLLANIKVVQEDLDKKYKDFLVKYSSFLQYWDNLLILKAEIDVIYTDIIARHKDITEKHGQVTAMYTEIIGLVDRAGQFADAAAKSAEVAGLAEGSCHISAFKAQQSADRALDSEEGALDSYNKTYELYLELQKGMIYRGTWNPNSGAYPPNGGTNSTWDVLLDSGQESVSFDGKMWFFGDRLIYVLSDDAWYQVEAGTVVKSINGKVGSVILTAADVGAVSKAGDTMSGTLRTKVSSHEGFIAERNGVQAMFGCSNTTGEFVFGGSLATTGDLTHYIRMGVNKLKWTNGGAEYDIYHAGNKPTAADVGLSNVNNWPATSNISDASSDKYATAEAVNTVEVKRQKTEELAFVYALIL